MKGPVTVWKKTMTNVLLVEDNVDNARALSRLLTRRGYTVTTAATGAEAVEKAGEIMPAVVLMDIGLPDFDGLEATRRIKADPGTAAIPVIALTAHALVEDRNSALDAGCIDFAVKPVDLTVLLGKIGAAMEAAPADAKGPGS
ncbi:response regulator [Roseospira visakhapatnamensis]|uniref:CheY-like chemotaxis protein n=1 Tax=Roseospira visakhapatnamensis TaxID=390880 RepID=A0A7W6RC74_9PROT|nr:response regulator [Roseospira visakhapatnamensis]MBB4265839.1 CheY-like chemotaxis protein [Roseospira visakhapatnamensis]